MVCHWAIAHEELKDVLAQDDEISGAFVDRLYADQNKTLAVAAGATGRGATAAVKPVNISDVGVSSEDAVSVLRDGILYRILVCSHVSETKYCVKFVLNDIEKPSSLPYSVFDSNHTQNMEQHRGRGRPPGSKVTLPVDPKNRKRTNRKVRDVKDKT